MKPIANGYAAQAALLNLEKPVRVYRNLATGLWSVKQGVVRFHTDCIFLKDAVFLVSEKSRQRVLRERQKNVHAYVQGYLTDRPTYFTVGADCYEVTYNPYKNRQFICEHGEVASAEICGLIKQNGRMRVFAAGMVLTGATAPDRIETVPVHML